MPRPGVSIKLSEDSPYQGRTNAPIGNRHVLLDAQAPQNLFVCAGERPLAQFLLIEPMPHHSCGFADVMAGGLKHLQGNSIASNGVFDDAKRLKHFRCQPKRLAGRPPYVGILQIQFEIGEFPEVSIHDSGGPLADQEAVTMPDDESHEATGSSANTSPQVRKFQHALLPARHALFPDRASIAARLS